MGGKEVKGSKGVEGEGGRGRERRGREKGEWEGGRGIITCCPSAVMLVVDQV